MPAPSFTRSISLAGQGSISRSFFQTKCQSPSDAVANGLRRPNRLELQAVLAHAQARKGTLFHIDTNQVLPGTGTSSYAQSPLREVTDAPPTPPTTPYLRSPDIAHTSRWDAWPLDGDDADLSLPSTPLNSPTLASTFHKPLERPSLFVMPQYARAEGQSKPLIGLGIIMDSSDLVSPRFSEPVAGAFLGLRITPRRVTENFAADPVVTPGELMRRNFPLTPGAPIHSATMPSESVGHYFPLTPGAPLPTATSDEALTCNFHRTPGASLYRRPELRTRISSMTRQQGTTAPLSLFEGLMANWGALTPASRCSSGGFSVDEGQLTGPTPLPTPAGW
ncbi:hypothetical protein DAEQUDRAFT_808710 [Daedalea quercina L-15889]|uniref:Uncharacterized protein n=1 Tax=Daedalea quercina L-15889 TaxID=1314783 RepID=A0A165TBH4_9APHY|nr:hypothetical protein DAEQUDRAFT_808710 [Daedalea quercina L-15889]